MARHSVGAWAGQNAIGRSRESYPDLAARSQRRTDARPTEQAARGNERDRSFGATVYSPGRGRRRRPIADKGAGVGRRPEHPHGPPSAIKQAFPGSRHDPALARATVAAKAGAGTSRAIPFGGGRAYEVQGARVVD